MRYAGEKKFNSWTVLTLLLLAAFLLFVIYPIGMLIAKSLVTGGSLDLSYFVKFFSSTKTLTVAIYSEVIRSNFGNAAAYSTILTLTSIVSLLIFFKVSGGKDVSV